MSLTNSIWALKGSNSKSHWMIDQNHRTHVNSVNNTVCRSEIGGHGAAYLKMKLP